MNFGRRPWLKGQGSEIEYYCEYPKHEFLTYLVQRKGLLLHGSNFPDIKLLIPIRVTKDTTSVVSLKYIDGWTCTRLQQ